MNKFYTIFIIGILFSAACIGQQNQPDFLYMSYNVENVFDTIDEPHKNDNEFLPNAARQWNSYRYYKKLNDIAKVIVAASENWHKPDVIGLCEIENKRCLTDLTKRTNLSRFGYRFIHYESRDSRGIDVAILYDPLTFSPISHKAIPVMYPYDSTRKTRDILYVKGSIASTHDTVHIFMCHLPSRRAGKTTSEPDRVYATTLMRKSVDSIFNENSDAHIIISGDFNDYAHDKSIVVGLQAQRQGSSCQRCLIRLEDPSAEGTYKYHNQWNFLDHGFVSDGFLDAYSITLKVVKNDMLLETNNSTGSVTPYRTYKGPAYHGGISDHLPITISFKKKQ